MVLFFISQDTPSLQKPENRGNLDQPQATVVFLGTFCDAAKKRKSNVLECSASPTPRDPKRMVFSHNFCIGKAHIWLAERAKFRGSHGGAPETGFKAPNVPHAACVCGYK